MRRAGAMLAALLVLTAACSSKDDADGSGESSTTTPAADPAELFGEPNEASGEPITVGVISDGATDAIDNTQGAEAAMAAIEYANDYLGGINGHPIEVETCETGQTPSGATTCAVEMVDAGVDAVLVGISGQDAAIYNGLAGSGIPYVSSATAAPDILLGEGAFVFANPIGGFAASVLLAEESGADHAAFVVIDVPAATAPDQRYRGTAVRGRWDHPRARQPGALGGRHVAADPAGPEPRRRAVLADRHGAVHRQRPAGAAPGRVRGRRHLDHRRRSTQRSQRPSPVGSRA